MHTVHTYIHSNTYIIQQDTPI